MLTPVLARGVPPSALHAACEFSCARDVAPGFGLRAAVNVFSCLPKCREENASSLLHVYSKEEHTVVWCANLVCLPCWSFRCSFRLGSANPSPNSNPFLSASFCRLDVRYPLLSASFCVVLMFVTLFCLPLFAVLMFVALVYLTLFAVFMSVSRRRLFRRWKPTPTARLSRTRSCTRGAPR